MISHIEVVDHGQTINAYEDAPKGRILAVLQRPRPYSKGPYVITVPRTGERQERVNAGFAMATLKRLAHREWHAINEEAKS